MAITLGKDVTISGISGVKSATVSSTANEVDVTVLGDTSRKFKKALVDVTIEIECVENPGVSAGGTFTIGGTATGNTTFICTSVKKDSPIDGVTTFTVSGSKTEAAAS
jgi:hypothetical protein